MLVLVEEAKVVQRRKDKLEISRPSEQCWKWVAPGAAWPAHHPRPQSEDLNLVCDTRAGPGPGAGAFGQPQPGAWDRGRRVAPGAWQILTSTDTHIQLHSCPDSPQPPLVCFTIDAKVSCALLWLPEEYRPAQHRLPPVPGPDPAPGSCWCSASVSRGLSRALSRLPWLSYDVTHPGVPTWQRDSVQWQQRVLHRHRQHLAAGQQQQQLQQPLGDESDCEYCEESIQNLEKFEGIHSKSFLQ